MINASFQSSASYVAAQSKVTRARAALDKVNADADRTRRLEERGVVSAAEGDASRAAVSDAQGLLEIANAELDSARVTLGVEGEQSPAQVVFDALPGHVFDGRVQSIAWGIDPGRNVQGGLVVNQPATRWFEPARRIPVRIELADGMDAWPKKVRVSGKVSATVFTSGKNNPVAWLARTVQRFRAWFSYLY